MAPADAPRLMSCATAALATLLLIACPGPGGGDATPAASGERDGDELIPVELTTVGLDRMAGAPIVLLRDPESGRVVPIWVGLSEAQAIARALHGIAVPRPMTHDLMASLLLETRAEVEEVLVHELRDNTYFGMVRLRLAGEESVREVDSRPSDALALALRTGAPIRVARKILVDAPDFDFIAPEGPDQVVHVLGITVVSATADLREEFGLPEEREGLVVTSVAGRAREEGLERGDFILEVNGEAVVEPIDLFEKVRETPAGEPVQLRYWRAGEEHDLELPADLPPERPRRGPRQVA